MMATQILIHPPDELCPGGWAWSVQYPDHREMRGVARNYREACDCVRDEYERLAFSRHLMYTSSIGGWFPATL